MLPPDIGSRRAGLRADQGRQHGTVTGVDGDARSTDSDGDSTDPALPGPTDAPGSRAARSARARASARSRRAGAGIRPARAPPKAGDAAIAGLIFRDATAGCIRSRVPRVNLDGTRIASVRVFLNGQLRRGLTVRTLQRRVTPRVTVGPGRYRLRVRVAFQRGTGSPPVTFTGVIRVCGASSPQFTG